MAATPITHTATSHKKGAGGAVNVVVEGIEDVVKEFTLHAETIRPLAAAVVVEHAAAAAENMRRLVPEGATKRTRDSITSDAHFESHSYTDTEVAAEAGPTWFVGRLLENGTINMPPRPFVGPAADIEIPLFERDMDKLASW